MFEYLTSHKKIGESTYTVNINHQRTVSLSLSETPENITLTSLLCSFQSLIFSSVYTDERVAFSLTRVSSCFSNTFPPSCSLDSSDLADLAGSAFSLVHVAVVSATALSKQCRGSRERISSSFSHTVFLLVFPQFF